MASVTQSVSQCIGYIGAVRHGAVVGTQRPNCSPWILKSEAGDAVADAPTNPGCRLVLG
jgi:hypothetical protein